MIATDKHVKSHTEIADQYVQDVLSGKIVSGELLRAACQRHVDDLAHGHERGLYFDERAANNACEFFGHLTHSDGEYAGKPFELFPWQSWFVASLFGWKRLADGYRRYRHAYLSVGRGNGKSPLAAAIALFIVGFDDPRAEVYATATKRDQALIAFDAAKRFVNHSPYLSTYFDVLARNINVPNNDSKFVPLSSEAKSADGLNINAVIRDELHAWREQHREFVEKINSAMGKRTQPLNIVITTAGNEDSQLWLEEQEFAELVVSRQNDIDHDDLFVAIYQIDEEDQPLDPAVWAKANPMLEHGVVRREFLEAEAAKAAYLPDLLSQFTRYYCNRFAQSSVRIISEKAWAEGTSERPDLEGAICHGGFDWGSRDDLAALGWVFPLDEIEVNTEPSLAGLAPLDADGQAGADDDDDDDQPPLTVMKRRYWVEADVWVPSHGTRHRDLAHPPFSQFIRNGELEVTVGEAIDVRAIYNRLEERMERHHLATIAFDPHNTREFSLRGANEYGLEMVEFRQNCAMYHEPLQELLVGLGEGRILHNGSGLLSWCATNLVAKTNTNEYSMPDKQKSTDKIDPIVAILMALSQAMFAERQEPSFYEDHEVEIG